MISTEQPSWRSCLFTTLLSCSSFVYGLVLWYHACPPLSLMFAVSIHFINFSCTNMVDVFGKLFFFFEFINKIYEKVHLLLSVIW